MLNLLSIPAIIGLGSINIALVDIIVLSVALIAVIYGAIVGFLKQILSILGGFAALALAIFTCAHVAEFISTTIPSIPEGISIKIKELFGINDIDGVQGTIEQIKTFLSTTSIPEFLHEIIAEAIVNSGGTLQIVDVLTNWALTVICFVCIFIVSLIVFAIIKKLFKLLTKIKIVGTTDKVLGLIFAVIKAVLLLVVVFVVLSMFTDVNAYLSPVNEYGEPVKCYFNDIMLAIMNSQLVKGLFKT